MTATAAWPVFEAALVGRDLVAERTMAFRFAKPADWTYRAGQFVDITLLDPPETDAEGNTRGFSISSAPQRGRDHDHDPPARHGLQAGPPDDAARHRRQDRRAVRGSSPAPRRRGRPSCSPAASASRPSGASSSRRSETAVCRTRWSSSTPIVDRRTRPSSTSSASWPSRTRTSPSFRRCRGWTRRSPGRASEATSMPRCSARHLDGVTDAIYYLTGPARHGPRAPNDARRRRRRRGRHPDRRIHRLLKGIRT